MKEKIIVFGLGKDFRRYSDQIVNAFDVVACTDSAVVPEDKFWAGRYIAPETICEHDYDKVLICSSRFRDAIRVRLVKMGIPTSRILELDFFDKNTEQQDFEEVIQDLELYEAINMDQRFSIMEDSLYLISGDKHKDAGIPCIHYFAQDIWGGKKIFHNNPKEHYDIGSRLDGFIAHLLTFREVNYIDIRPLPHEIPGLHFIQGDATDLEGFLDDSIESLSCFHAMEHFGLGRYGDKVEPDAYRKAAESMQRVVRKGGHLYIGVPVGPTDKVVFNAHRIFTISTILSLFGEMKLQDCAIVEPEGVCAKSMEAQNYLNIREFSCGLFEFIKI